jgi:hypothetical protein
VAVAVQIRAVAAVLVDTAHRLGHQAAVVLLNPELLLP